MSPQQNIQNLVSQARQKDALDALRELIGNTNEYIMQASKHNSNERDNGMGILSTSEYRTAWNNINANILRLAGCDATPASSSTTTIVVTNSSSTMFTAEQIEAILLRDNVEHRQQQELGRAAKQVLDLFRTSLTTDEFEDLCLQANRAYRNYANRMKDPETRDKLIDEISELFEDYKQAVITANEENILEILYKEAEQKLTADTVWKYFEMVIKKDASYEEMRRPFEFDIANASVQTAGKGQLTQRIADKKVAEKWLRIIGRH